MSTLQLAQSQCSDDSSQWCRTILDWTGNPWLANYSKLLVATPLKVLSIIVLAFLVRYVLHKIITKLSSTNGHPPRLLQPLRERNEGSVSGETLAEQRSQRARTLGSVLKSIVSFVIFGFAAIYILQEFGVNLGPLIASAGVVGVALGFGAQNLVRDFLAGMFMMVEDQYGVGDWVDLGEAIGTVETVGLRVTTLRDVNGTVWYVRNGEILRVGNSSQGYAVAVVDLPIAHSSDARRAQEVAESVAGTAAQREPLAKDVLAKPEMLGINQITSDTITLRLTAKVRPGQQWAVQRLLRAEIKRAYDEADIKPPYPAGRLMPDSGEQQ
ncbi:MULTISPECIES: mechanosensitive ion channel domain-containing protein [unclassified Actinopolyspora]|uniref:mechanosensitive ion channel family protein n=1 Tax=unclassified Actinopolyspora TaxID=2639451 RepID=UPI0013F5A480|nr:MULTISPECIES: mechanosensitive ion channel domain-containing protein [unclassified Actinopolyspora]NHD18417.1 mechanosensitive ion channel [Actinopolyspora sp. BKK2]NHE77624.1 mechanosensitive ion channel [Actinopolyspora sp. BKK1]